MTTKRPKELKWVGENYGDGRPVYFLNNVEPRDHSEEETAALSDEQINDALKSGLYEGDKPSKEGKA